MTMIAEYRPGETSAADVMAEHRALLERAPSSTARPDDTLLVELDAFIHKVHGRGVSIPGEADRRICQSIIDYWTAVLYRAGQEPADLLLRDFDPNQSPELPDEACPYMGLEAFDESQAERFFGRRQVVSTLLGQISQNPVLAVVGPSGSGKSSIVRAGLVPALKRGEVAGSRGWRYLAPIVPSTTPLDALARLFAPGEGDLADWVRAQVAALRCDPLTLVRLVEASGSGPAVLVVDQFEELYTRHADEVVGLSDDARAFCQALVALVREPHAKHRVILTLRVDFESYIELTPDLAPLFRAGRVAVPPLSPAELRESIERPAAQIGLVFEDGIVDDILRGVVAEPTALPLLQFTLLKLWEARERNRVTWRAYTNVIADPLVAVSTPQDMAQTHRGPRWVLKHAADRLYYQDLLPEEQDALRYILLRLVRPAEGSEVVSARVPRYELCHGGGPASDRVSRVLDKLIAVRLVRQSAGSSADEQLVEVAHEALVRNWPLLGEWLTDERERLRDRMHLTAAAQAWQKGHRDRGVLWRGNQLAQAEVFGNLGPLETQFVAASKRAQRLTYAVRAIFAGVLVAALGAIVVLLLANANAATRFARSWALAADAEAHVRSEPDLALLLGLQAYTIERTDEARDFLLRAAIANPRLFRFLRTDQTLTSDAVAIRPDGSTIVAAHTSPQLTAEVSVWDTSTGRPAEVVPLQTTLGGSLVALSPAADRVTLANPNGHLTMWDTSTRAPLASDVDLLLDLDNAPAPAQTGRLSNLVMAGGGWVALSSDDRVSVWQPEMGRQVIPITRGQAEVGRLAISRDGSTVAWIDQCSAQVVLESACTRLTIHVRRVSEPDSERRLPSQAGPIASLALSSDGRTLAFGGGSGFIVDATTGLNPRPFTPVGDITTLAFSPDGRLVASGDNRGAVDLWDASTGVRHGSSLDIHRGQSVRSLAFSADGKQLVATYAGAGEPVLIWDADRQAGEHAGPSSTPPPPRSEAKSANGRWDAVGGCGLTTPLVLNPAGPAGACTRGKITLTDLQTHQSVDLTGHSDRVTGLAYYGNGVLASASRDGTVLLWDPATRQSLGPALETNTSKTVNMGVDFTDDGRLIAGNVRSQSVWQFDLAIEPFDATQRRVCAMVNRGFNLNESDGFHLAASENPCPRLTPSDRRTQEAIP